MARFRQYLRRIRAERDELEFMESVVASEKAHRRAIRPHVSLFDATAADHGFIPSAPVLTATELRRRKTAAARLATPLRGAR